MFETVKKLTELPGMVGNEELVNQYLLDTWKPYVKKVELTGVGNLIAHIGGKSRRLLIEAHADEIGFLVKSISHNGFLWIAPKNDRMGRPGRETFVIGQPALVMGSAGAVEGVFATVTGHVTPPQHRQKKELSWDDVFVDLGANSEEGVRERGVNVGNAVIWNPATRRIGSLICGKAMDDRVGLAVMTELLKRLDVAKLQYDLYFASTVQEEMGLLGATSLERERAFDLAIALDVGLSGDIPLVDEKDMPVRLGAGPILVYHDSGVDYDRRLTRVLSEVARGADIPVQHAVFQRYSSDGRELIKLGIRTVLVAFPTRYTHSPFETVHERDLIQTVELLQKFLECELIV